MRRAPFPISPLWKLCIFLQALAVAWIGFTHGSGIELFLQKFTLIPERSVLSWDRNSATLIAVLALLSLWRPSPKAWIALALIYGVETLLATLSGGSVDNRLPLLGNAVHFVLPLAGLALAGRRWALLLIQTALVVTVGSYALAFLNAAPYFLDALIGNASRLGWTLSEARAQAILVGTAVLLLINLIWGSRHWVFLLVFGLFACALAAIHWLNFGRPLLPEALLKTEVFAAALVLWRQSYAKDPKPFKIAVPRA